MSVDKKPIGFGKLIRADGGVIFATFLTGEAEGEGLRIYKDGSFFEGNFRAGKAYGKGIYENSSIYY